MLYLHTIHVDTHSTCEHMYHTLPTDHDWKDVRDLPCQLKHDDGGGDGVRDPTSHGRSPHYSIASRVHRVTCDTTLEVEVNQLTNESTKCCT